MSHYLDALLALDHPASHPNKPKQPDRTGLLGTPQAISTEKSLLSANERQSILNWLHINEGFPDEIGTVMYRCATNMEARDYFLWRSGLGSEPKT